MELKNIRGIGPKTIELLNKVNINNIDELLRYYPFRYNVYKPINITEALDNEIVVVSGIIETSERVQYIKRNFNRLSFSFQTSNIVCNVVIFNRAFLATHLTSGKEVTLIGKYDKLKNTFTANDIKLYGMHHTMVEPVYHLVSGLKPSILTKSINSILSTDYEIKDIIPYYINDRYEFLTAAAAVKEIHNPHSSDVLKKAQVKLKYEELFEFMFKINFMKYKNQITSEFVEKEIDMNKINEIIKSLPFTLTNDQMKAIKDIQEDFETSKRMNRLILGDVGSGKTIVSFIAILMNYYAGYQSALMSPTEVLAIQHYENFTSLFPNLNVRLLVGSTKAKEKREIIEALKDGSIDLVIGTHTLIEDNIEFNNIGLVITDEQHRFGVNQRKSLQNKGRTVDVLYMSATPIPRTYALTIYGDMDISMIKEKPSGRKEIITTVSKFNEIKSVLEQIKEEVTAGHQVYIVSPLIEENEELDLNDVLNIKHNIDVAFNNKVSTAILHGKLKAKEKEEIMNEFKSGNIQILISTTVIEVGVDVKNATMMVIYNAERFGLATLHQLRGRVGRNSLQSKCILISDNDAERLHVMEESNDGFYISEKDFELRGSGDLFGIRQSGDMIFKIADIRKDYKILLQCKKDTDEFILNNIENNFRDYPYFTSLVTQLLSND